MNIRVRSSPVPTKIFKTSIEWLTTKDNSLNTSCMKLNEYVTADQKEKRREPRYYIIEQEYIKVLKFTEGWENSKTPNCGKF